MWTRKELKEKAKKSFNANYWLSVLAGIIISIASSTGGSSAGRSAQNANNSSDGASLSNFDIALIAGIILAAIFAVLVVAVIKIVVGNALHVGALKILIKNGRRDEGVEKPVAGDIVSAFQSGCWSNVVLIMFLKDLFIGLWTLLFIVPGIIKTYEYRMIPYLLSENPNMDRAEAFRISKEMMDGQKMKAFLLDLSFIPWLILTVLTCGILGVFYVNPYIYQTETELYLTLLKENGQQNTY